MNLSQIISKIGLSIVVLCFYKQMVAMDNNNMNVHFQITNNKITALDHKDLYVGSLTYYCDTNTKKCVLINFNVLPEEQKKGIGSQLFLMFLNNVKMMGISDITWKSYDTAVTFYQRFVAKIFPRCSEFIHMEFNFERDGDPVENLEKYCSNKSKSSKSKIFSYLYSYFMS